MERLAPVLPGMARDLAQARRENVAQKRELEELPARLTLPDRSSDASRARPRKAAQIVNDRTALAGGTSLGRVRDVVVLVGSRGEVVGYEIDTAAGGTGYIPLPAQLAVSGSTLVVPDATKEFVEDDLVGLGGSVDAFRSKLGMQ